MATSGFFSRMRPAMNGDGGFALIEVVVAMGVIFISMTVLAATAGLGFKGVQTARQRETATALADQLIEEVRALPFTAVTQGLKDSDLSADANVVNCSSIYKYQSCSGETIAHQAVLTYTSTPLYPHKVTLGSAAGFPQGGWRAVYVTSASGSTGVYRVTVIVTWTSGGSTSSVQTQTLLSNPTGSGGTSTSSGSSIAYYYGSGSVSPGSVVVTPNGSVYQGVGVSGLSTSVWNTTDSMTQRLYSMDSEIDQGQVTTVNGQATATSVEKSISGVVTSSGGSSTYSVADDDPTTSGIGTSSAPTGISQSGPSISLTGSGNSLTMNQYTQTTTTTTTTGNVTKRNASYATSTGSSVTITAPAGMSAGDLLLADLSFQGACMTTPSGWTLIRCDTNGNNATSAVFYRFATSADVSAGSFSFTTGGSSGTVGGIIAYTGSDPANPIDTSAVATGSSSTATTPSLNPNTSNARLVAFFAARGNTSVTPVDPGSANGGATNWGQNWSATAGNSQDYYLTSTPALATTAGSGTLSSGSTTSSTFVTAKTFAVTVGTSLPGGTHTWPLQVSISAASPATEYEYRFYLAHQNSSGTTLSQSGYSTTFTGTGTKSYTFSWDPGTWATGDKLAVVWEHRKIGGSGTKSGTMNTTSASFLDPTGVDFWAGGASAGGNKQPPGQGVAENPWSATLGQSVPWVAQMVSLIPNTTTTTTTTTDYGTYGTETGSTVSTTAASASPACGSPSQTDGKPCAYATQSYAVPSGVDNAFLATTVDFSNSTNGYSALGTCRLYKFSPPNSSPTNYADGDRQVGSGVDRVAEDVSRSYGTSTFGQMCSGTGTTPSNWPGYFVKFDAGTSASRVTAQAGTGSSSPSASSAGTITVWNGSGTTSFSVPTSGTWSTSPSTVSYTTNSNYRYDISAVLGSGQTYTTSSGSSPITEAKAVVGAPVTGTITYKLTDVTNNRVLIDVTLTVDLGTLTSYTKYTAAA
jgi:type II secretory pathway pseudopilin PulG